MNATEFLKRAKRIGDVHAIFRFPYVHVFVISQSFAGLEDEDREVAFSGQLKASIGDLRKTLQNSLLMLRLVTPDEYKSEHKNNGRTRGHHWLSAFVDQV